jgi:glycosyltransferase involved in cell wall biosynthesis
VTLTVRKLEQEILEAGHHVMILTTNSGDPANTHLAGKHPNRTVVFLDNAKPIPFVHDPNNPGLTYQIGFGLSPRIKRELELFECSIIHLTCPDCTALHLIEYARTKELPIMGTYHSNIPEYMEHYPGLSWLKHILAAFFRHQYNFLQALYVPTPFIHRHLTDTYQMDRVTQLQVWGHGVDIDTFHPSKRSLQYRRNLGIGDHEVVVLWVSRLVPEKRPDIFGNVIRRLHEQNLPFHALVVGAGQCEEEIKALPNTTFAGWMNEQQLSVAYASSDIFLFPSAVETFGLVTLEAAASGLPVIVESGCSGHLVRDGETGYSCLGDDEDAYFEATYDLIVNKQKRLALSTASRLLAQSWEKRAINRKMLEFYSQVTDEFFTEYGGRHANRDAAYTKADSFTAGSHPRPTLLVFVEWLFIMLFTAIWNMIYTFVYVQHLLLPSQRFRQAPSPEGLHLGATASLKNRTVKQQESIPTVVEFSSLDLENDSTSTETGTTASSSSDSEPSCGLPSPPQSQSIGDAKVFHAIAKTFIRSIVYICRTESRFRNWCHAHASPPAMFRKAKRKDSNYLGYDFDKEATKKAQCVPEMICRARSEGCDVALVDEPLVALSEGHRLRRSVLLLSDTSV